MAQNLIFALVISIVIQVIAVLFGGKLFAKFPKNKKDVMHYGLICSNSVSYTHLDVYKRQHELFHAYTYLEAFL